MTEEEAKQKWCSHSRVGGPKDSEADGVAWNRWPGDQELPVSTRCIGSLCMAWRVDYEGSRIENRGVMLGYCGLAGKP